MRLRCLYLQNRSDDIADEDNDLVVALCSRLILMGSIDAIVICYYCLCIGVRNGNDYMSNDAEKREEIWDLLGSWSGWRLLSVLEVIVVGDRVNTAAGLRGWILVWLMFLVVGGELF